MHTLVVVAGPTAVGKTSFAIELAKQIGTEILSADSRQFYSELAIGAARPSDAQLKEVPHHFIAQASVKNPLTADSFRKQALDLLESKFRQHPILILCGGSGLYIDAVCKGFHPLPEPDQKLRENLEHLLKTDGIAVLQQKLKNLDPEYFERIDHGNPRRLIRSIELNMQTGKNMAELMRQPLTRPSFRIVKFCLNMTREMLYERINQRVDEMILKHLEDEALALYHLRKLAPLQTVGYKEFFDFFEGQSDYQTTINLIKQHTRNFAKRQLTWFRKDPDYYWIDYPFSLNQVLNIISEHTQNPG